jgi:hypothetical protein
MMEPLRPVIDGAVLEFAVGQMFSTKDFVVRSDGACRLSPQLAKAVAGDVQRKLASRGTEDGVLHVRHGAGPAP